MLTGDLLAFTRRRGRLLPRRLDPAEPALLAAAEALLDLFRAHIGQRRGELEEALAGFLPPGLAPKVVRGLGRLLMDRSAFEVGGEVEPRELRAELFDGAARAWRGRGAAGLAEWREELVARAGRSRGLTPAQVSQTLYADIPDNQLLAGIRPLTPEGLLYRYNVAQVQGLLLRAERLTLTAPPPGPARLRQLFRYLRFFGLLFEVKSSPARPGGGAVRVSREEDERGGLTLVVDGPLSLLESGSRYGLNLAQFFPALLLWGPPWQLSCDLTPRAGGAAATLELAPHPHLRSHYPDHGQWVPEDARQFVAGFNGLGGPWRAAPADEIITLPGNAYLIPDFVFRRPGSDGPFFLEYLRYPVAEQVRRRLELVEANGVSGYLVACRAVPALRELEQRAPGLFTFRRGLLPGQFRKFLDGLAGGRSGAAARESLF